MDTFLAKQIVDLGVPVFGESMKNKGDSKSCMYDPRKLLSSRDVLHHVGKKFKLIIKRKCSGSAVIGMSTSGIAWATIASLYTGLPMLYVRKKLEPTVSGKYIEGILPKNKKLILVDDLLFASESKREAIEILKDHGCTVTDILVVIDRQIQRKKDGPKIQDDLNIKLHSLINMSETVKYMQENSAITKKQLKSLIRDYQRFDRWDMPTFAL